VQRTVDPRPHGRTRHAWRRYAYRCGLLLLLVVASACSKAPTATPDVQVSTPAVARATATPETTPTPTASPSPTPTAVATLAPLPFAPTSAVVTLPTTTRSAPSTTARAVRQLAAGTTVDLLAAERGENWMIGEQDWVPVSHDWERTWYRLADGSYVYRPFVLLAGDGIPSSRASAERYVVVDLGQQMAWAMEGDRAVRAMPMTSGSAEFETPTGAFAVQARVANERMTSSSAGFDESEFYDVHNVLFTQYFAAGGFALHLNYWQPTSVFGVAPTSHGCIGLQLPDAQFLWLFGSPGMRVIVRESGGATPVPPPAPTASPSPSATPAPTPTPTPTAKPTAIATPVATLVAPPPVPTASALPSATPSVTASPRP